MLALFVPYLGGLGHVVRCGALADELRLRGWGISAISSLPSGIPDCVIYDGEKPRAAMVKQAKSVCIVDKPQRAHVDLLVWGSAGAERKMFKDSGAKRVLAGPDYALLRPTFRAHREQGWDGERTGVLDVREISDRTDTWIAYEMLRASLVITYGGMRAMEAACVGTPLEIHARNVGERLNKEGLEAGAVVDGLGCQRVADAIEEVCR